MSYFNGKQNTRSRLLASAITGVVAMHVAAPAVAQTTIDLDFLNQQFTQLVISTSPAIETIQRDQATNVIANVESSGGAGIEIRADLINSGSIDDTIDGSFSLSANSIYGEAYSNTVTNTISATTTPLLSDSSAIGSTQVNQTDTLASASGATVEINIEAFDTEGNYLRTLSGGSAVIEDNSVDVLANGNSGTNSIVIGAGVSISGVSEGATSQLSSADLNSTTSTTNDLSVASDLAIVSAQINEGDLSSGQVDIVAESSESDMRIRVEDVTGSTLQLTDNSVTTNARGNTVSNSLATGGSAASIDAAIALVSSQANDSTTVRATTEYSDVAIIAGWETSGAVVDSSLKIDSNEVSSAAYGNNAVQTLSLDANAIVSNNTTEARIGEGSVSGSISVAGMVTVSNLQLASDTNVSAFTQWSDFSIEVGDGYADSGAEDLRNTITVSDNMFDAVAVNNRSTTQAISLDGNDVGTGIAVASSQFVSDGSDTTAGSYGNDIWIESNAVSGSVNSTLTIENNLDRALAIANTGATSIAITANDVVIASDAGVGYASGSVSFERERTSYGDGNIAEVAGSYITLNDQFVDGNIYASVSGGSIHVNMSGGDTSNSTINLVDNATLSAALGNDASNTITLSVNDINVSGGTSGSGFATVAAVMTQQSSVYNTTEAQASTETYVFTNNDVWDSSVSTDRNSVEALAIANRATGNKLTVNANNIDTAYQGESGSFVEIDGDTYDPRASFLVQNAQQASGATVTAMLTDSVEPNLSAEIETILDEDTARSNISTDGNILRATATSNTSENILSLTAGATTATSVGLGNFQETDGGDLNAVIGYEGTLAVEYDGFNFGGSTDGVNVFTSNTGVLSGLDSNQIAYLQATYGTDLTLDYDNDQIIIANVASGTSQFTVPAGSVSGTNQLGGAFVRIASTINTSTISVAGNVTEGKVTGNTANNTVLVEANQLLEGAGVIDANLDSDYQVIASNMAQNTQLFYDTSANTDVFGSFAIDTSNSSINNSTLTVDGNSQLASATANNAVTTLSVKSNDMQATTGLQNQQVIWAEGADDITATSDVWVYAPMSLNTSTLELTNNVSQARTRGNIAVNNVDVTANTITAGSSSPSITFGEVSAIGGVVLTNIQDYTAEAMQASSAIDVFNEHLTEPSAGLSSSTANIDGNVTLADANANRATNELVFEATNIDTATGGLFSDQNASGGSIGSLATGSFAFDLSRYTSSAAAVADSTVTVDGNQSTALTTVNQVENSIDVIASNISGDQPGALADFIRTSGTFALVNDQYSNLAGTAQVENVDYSINLSSSATLGYEATNATLSVGGNQSTAQVLGNKSSNELNVAANSSEMASYAINGVQRNDGNLVASVANVSSGVGINGENAALNSVISVSDNGSLANAIANVATNSMVLNAAQMNALGGTATAVSDPMFVQATAVVRNDQENAGSVFALNDTVRYSAVLNAETSALSGSSVELSNNSVVSQAIGNSAQNSLIVDTLASDSATYGMQSSQSNTGNITAAVLDASVNLTTVGNVSGALASVSSNTLGASATANSVVNVMRR